MADLAEMTRTGALGAIGAGQSNGDGGWHPGHSAGTLGAIFGLFLGKGVNLQDSQGSSRLDTQSFVFNQDKKPISWSSHKGNKMGDKLFKNLQEGTAKASQGIVISGSGGGEGFTPLPTPSGGGGRSGGGGQSVA